jgi:proteasome lid subunit RPN8/RPN11
MDKIKLPSCDLKIPTDYSLWLNEHDPSASKHLTAACARRVRAYMRSNLRVELGCIIKRLPNNQFDVIPFVNGDPTMATIRMIHPDDFETLVKLYMDGSLWGWFHSHPMGRPYPSWTDLTMHQIDVNMGIYGGATDRMSIFNTKELDLIQGLRVSITNQTMDSVDKEIKSHG